MKLLKITISVFLLSLMIINNSNIYGSLKDFKGDVEKEENENRGKHNNSSKNSNNGCIEDLFSSIGEFLAKIWLYHNLNVYYSQYPYHNKFKHHFFNYLNVKKENNNSFKSYNDTSNDSNQFTKNLKTTQDSDNIYKIIDPKTKKNIVNSTGNMSDSNSTGPADNHKYYFYSLLVSGMQTKDNGSGFFARLDGRFYKIIGPDFEGLRISNDQDHLDYYAFGINIPIIQNDYFSPSFYIQAAMFRGILSRNGVAYGIQLKSYPLKPISLFIKYGGIDFKYINFIDFETRLGLSYYRFELFIGYRLFKAEYAKINAALAGINIHI